MNRLDTTVPAAASEPWHSRPPGEVLSAYESHGRQGLTAAQARERIKRHGANVLRQRDEEPWWREALESLTEPLQLLLIAVAAAYFLLGEIEDALTILAVIVAVSGIEVANELRAKRAIASLSGLSAPNATLIRDGQILEVPAAEVVPGDLVFLAPGKRVPADLRLLETAALRIDESCLTGESVPVSKDADAVVPESAELGDRHTMVYSGTLVTAGKGRGLAIATGRTT